MKFFKGITFKVCKQKLSRIQYQTNFNSYLHSQGYCLILWALWYMLDVDPCLFIKQGLIKANLLMTMFGRWLRYQFAFCE